MKEPFDYSIVPILSACSVLNKLTLLKSRKFTWKN